MSRGPEPPFYAVDAALSWRLAWLLGLQHLLGMFVGIVSPPLIIASTLGLSFEDKALLVSTSLLTSGFTTLIQVHRVGPIGSGLLSVTGPSFVFVPLAIAAAKTGGMSLVFGLALSCCWIPAVVALSLRWIHRFFPPVVTGTAIALIGFSLIQVGFTQLAGGAGIPDLGHPRYFALGLCVLAAICWAQRKGGYWASFSLVGGLVFGSLVAVLTGQIPLERTAQAWSQARWLEAPRIAHFGLTFQWSHCLTWAVAYLLVSLECIGDLTATCVVSRQPTSGDQFANRLRGGLLSDSLGCLLTALLNAFPKTTFAQNNGIIALTGVASRRAGYAVGILLILCGLFPKIAALVSLLPSPVLGGATLVMFSTVAITGLHTALGPGWNPRNHLILAISLGLGLGMASLNHQLIGLETFLNESQLSPALRGAVSVICESGLALGCLSALILNLVLPQRIDGHSQEPAD